jgi:hypothetical protein
MVAGEIRQCRYDKTASIPSILLILETSKWKLKVSRLVSTEEKRIGKHF